jgi:hypothetical protein
MLVFANAVFAGDRIYTSERFGVSFEVSPGTVVEESTEKGKTRIWFKSGASPVAPGVLFEVKGDGGLDAFLARERAGQEKGGYRSEVSEREYPVGGGATGTEFVRDAAAMGVTMHYFLFPSADGGRVFGLWLMQHEPDAETLGLYERMRDTVKVIR